MSSHTNTGLNTDIGGRRDPQDGLLKLGLAEGAAAPLPEQVGVRPAWV